MSLQSKVFTVGLSDSLGSNTKVVGICDDTPGRTSRRVVINADVLKSARVFAGDVVAVCKADTSTQHHAFAVGIAWPSSELAQNCEFCVNLFFTILILLQLCWCLSPFC